MVSFKEGEELARMYGFKFFETSIYQNTNLEMTTHIKSIFKELVRDIINLKKYEDDAKGSFSLKNDNSSKSKVREENQKRCSC